MHYFKYYFSFILLLFLLSINAFAQTNNQIEGRVYTESNAPVNNSYVELYNDVDLLLNRTRSSSQGRFSFRGLRAGRYIVKVKPYGTNLLEATERVEIQNLGSIPVTEYVDFRLEIDRRFTKPTETIVGTIYAQEVPSQAKRLFESGAKKLKDGDKTGTIDIEDAIKIFPTYFDALNLLGREYISQGNYKDGYPFLLKAIDVNNRCSECFYSLSVAFYKLDQIEAGIKAANATITLVPNSPDAHLLLGILYLTNKNYSESEKALNSAKELYKEPNPEIYWQLARLYNRTERNKEAADELEKYLKVKPDINSREKMETLDTIDKLRKKP